MSPAALKSTTEELRNVEPKIANLFRAKHPLKAKNAICRISKATPRMPTMEAKDDFDALRALGVPDEITLRELLAEGAGQVYNDGIIRTEEYKAMHQAFVKLCKNFTYPSLVQLRQGHDGKNVSSYKKGPNMDLFLEVC